MKRLAASLLFLSLIRGQNQTLYNPGPNAPVALTATLPYQEASQQQVDARNRHSNNAFLFSSEDLAGRVAKTMIHAVELCGGGRSHSR
jgi:hypothetical protein